MSPAIAAKTCIWTASEAARSGSGFIDCLLLNSVGNGLRKRSKAAKGSYVKPRKKFVDDTALQFALREMHKLLNVWQFWTVMAAIVFMLTVSGPFGTLEAMGFAPRLAYWTAIAVLTSLPGFTIAYMVNWAGYRRGWSTLLRIAVAGALASRPHWDGVVCATQGDVTHWIHISADEAVSAQTVLTPRLVTALGGSASADADALADTLSRPERLAAHLRQAEIAGNRAAMTGHLLGAELAATRPYWLGQKVLVISATPAPHMTALEGQGVPSTALDPNDLVAPGLAALGRAIGLVEG
jgi:hypothetical protein